MEQISKEPYKLYNQILHYDWGTKNENAFIPRLLNIKVEKDLPYAELWVGAHPKAPSKIMYNGKFISLLEVINKFPTQILGEYVATKFGNTLPFLFKILSAEQALSIQMHPTKKDAAILHSKDPVNYPDANHKPEIAIALDNLDALVGLKSFSEIKSILSSYNAFRDFYGSQLYSKFISPDENNDVDLIKEFYSATMRIGEDEVKLGELLQAIETTLLEKETTELQEKYFLKNKKIFGNDVGLLSFFFYNLVSLNKDEGFFTEAGIPHSYLKGNIIECMANSDNVIRSGLTPKFKDVDSLLSLIRLDSATPAVMKSNGKVVKYKSDAEEFELTKITLKNDEKYLITTGNRIQIVFILEGEVVITNGLPNKFNFIKGESFMVPAIMGEYSVISRNNSIFILVSVP